MRVYSGPVPKHVKLSATLSCPRDVFFDVYMGRLDPMTAVLTGKAHCSGYRYMALLHFGQAFQLETTKWHEFYAAQEEVQKDQRRRAANGGLLLGPGSSSGGAGGSASAVSGSNSTLRLTSGSSGSGDANSGFALPAGSGSGALAFAPALGFSAALGLVDWARARAAAAASRIAVAMRATTVDSSSVAALAAPSRSCRSHWRISAHAPVPPPFAALRRSPSASAALAPTSGVSALQFGNISARSTAAGRSLSSNCFVAFG